jgi:hypothetical protein
MKQHNMKQHLLNALLLSAIILPGCKTSKNLNSSAAQAGADKLIVRYIPVEKQASKDRVMLSFTVKNTSNSSKRFCKWETPFEPRLGKYFDITNANGNEATFKGAMARRVMPPPAEAYITVAAHDSVNAVINLADNYTFSNGNYTIKYTGGGVSGMETGDPVKVMIKP